LSKYKPSKVTQYSFAKRLVKKRNSTETLVSDVSNANSEFEARNEELLEIIGHDEHAEEDEHSEDES